MWDVEVTDEFKTWYWILDEEDRDAVNAAVTVLEEQGPNLSRPLVDHIENSRIKNLKELRPREDNIRILFCFDPRRSAILLVGGDKTGQWNKWYSKMIPIAEKLYDRYLKELEEENLL